MRSPYDFIVKPIDGRRYDNTKDIGGVELITSTSDEDHTSANRFGEVIATPIGYEGPIKIGDTLLVHHNVFKFYNDMQGVQKSGRSWFKDDLFFIDEMQHYMYHNGKEWNTVGHYSFIEPIAMEQKDDELYMNVKELPLTGKMRYPSEAMKAMGINKGDIVTYYPDMEYEFNVEDNKLYRLMDRHITVKL